MFLLLIPTGSQQSVDMRLYGNTLKERLLNSLESLNVKFIGSSRRNYHFQLAEFPQLTNYITIYTIILLRLINDGVESSAQA